MADQDVKMLIERIMAEARTHQSARFSNKIYADEPILKTGRQMQNFLPDQYRKMREISRWQDDPKGGAGRWLSEAELFYRQGLLMADFEDDCPYNGTFKSYFPTYNAMSDRQLRGYFTWRAQVRRQKSGRDVHVLRLFISLRAHLRHRCRQSARRLPTKSKPFGNHTELMSPASTGSRAYGCRTTPYSTGSIPNCSAIPKRSYLIRRSLSCAVRHAISSPCLHPLHQQPNAANPPSRPSPCRPMRRARSD